MEGLPLDSARQASPTTEAAPARNPSRTSAYHRRDQDRARTLRAQKVRPALLVYSGFDQAFDDWCDHAELPSQCTAHGVRKAAAALMYENGASEAELCAIFGWKIGSRMARSSSCHSFGSLLS